MLERVAALVVPIAVLAAASKSVPPTLPYCTMLECLDGCLRLPRWPEYWEWNPHLALFSKLVHFSYGSYGESRRWRNIQVVNGWNSISAVRIKPFWRLHLRLAIVMCACAFGSWTVDLFLAQRLCIASFYWYVIIKRALFRCSSIVELSTFL